MAVVPGQGHRWGKGESGNPKGGPVKSRALTALLERAGSKTLEVDGKKVTGKQWLARALWHATTTGTVQLPTGVTLTVDAEDWFAIAKWIYAQVDGPPAAQTNLSVSGQLGIEVAETIVTATSERPIDAGTEGVL